MHQYGTQVRICQWQGVNTSNWPDSQILQSTWTMSNSAPFRTEMCACLFWMVHCGIWDRYIVGFVRLVYSDQLTSPQMMKFSNSFHGSSFLCPLKLLRGECHGSPLMINQHYFRYWLGAIRQQAITWVNVHPDQFHHMASVGHKLVWSIYMYSIKMCFPWYVHFSYQVLNTFLST